MRGFYWIAIVVIIASIARLLVPLNAMDTAWDFGHAYTLLRGDSGIAYNDYLHDKPDYLYGLVIAPIAALSSSIYVPKVFYSILLALLAVVLFIRKERYNLSIGLILLIISNYIILTNRPEIFTILIGCLAYPYLFIENRINWKVSIPLGFILFLIHPPNAFLMGAAVLASKNLLIKKSNIYLVIYSCTIVLITYILLSTPQIHHFSILKNRILEGNPLMDFRQFLMYSGITLIALAIAKRKIWAPVFIINYSVLFLLCILLGPYYYYIFLLVPFVLTTSISKGKITQAAVTLAVIFNVYTNIIHHTIVHLENPSYAEKALEINAKIVDLARSEPTHTVFIDQHIGLPLYAKSRSAKMIMNVANQDYFIVTPPKNGDIAFFTKNSDAHFFAAEINEYNKDYETRIIKVTEPVKGKLTLQSLYRNRTDSLGLYKMTISENAR